MIDDRERLVEVVARGITPWAWDARYDPPDAPGRNEALASRRSSIVKARRALAALAASGTHKVIPVWLWDDMRDAYLTETAPQREDCDPDHNP